MMVGGPKLHCYQALNNTLSTVAGAEPGPRNYPFFKRVCGVMTLAPRRVIIAKMVLDGARLSSTSLVAMAEVADNPASRTLSRQRPSKDWIILP